jgi:hypothetical protein
MNIAGVVQGPNRATETPALVRPAGHEAWLGERLVGGNTAED